MSHGIFRAPPVGELQPHFPQYTLHAFVAVGGMGAVYRATQLSVDRPVALKILPPELACDEIFCKRFTMEAKAMAKLSHRNLVQIHDFGETNGIFWMIQEWVEGRTIFEVMHDEGRLAPKEAAALVAQACEGLGYAHKQGIVHRDVKPANMMLDKEGVLKLMDFGLARATHGGPEALRTQRDERFATEEYAAPELWEPEAVIDHRVDIFALGVLLYEALTGSRPTGTFRVPSELRPGLDVRFDEVVSRAMQRNPANRFQSCGELLVALRRIVTTPPQVRLVVSPKSSTGAVRLQAAPAVPADGKGGSGVEWVDQEQPAPAGKRGLKAMLVAVAVLLVAGLLGGGWMVLKGGGNKGATAGESEPSGPENGDGAGGQGAVGPATGPKETPQERVNRQAREHMERLAAISQSSENNPGPDSESAPTDDPAPEPESGPDPEPDGPPVAIGERLAEMDAELRGATAAVIASYTRERADLDAKYLAECTKEEAKGVEAGDLDAVVFWQDEMALIKSGAAPGDDGAAPARAVALRTAWRKRLGPSLEAIAPLQRDYLEALGALEAEAGSEEGKSALQERREQVSELHHFIALCSGKAPPFAELAGDDPAGESEEEAAERVARDLPPDLLAVYRTTRERLDELHSRGETEGMAGLIKSFGSSLVRSEKALTQKREIPAARAVRTVKDEMVARLKDLERGAPAAPGPAPGPQPGGTGSEMVLVRSGDPTDDCLFDKQDWKRRGKVIQSQTEEARLMSRTGIGPGDFTLQGTFTMSEVGATDTLLAFGDLYLVLDGQSGAVEVYQPWLGDDNLTSGAQLGSLVQADQPFNLVVERRGTDLQLRLNGKVAATATTHDGELGALMVRSGSGTLGIEGLELRGRLLTIPSMQVLHGAKEQYSPVAQVQLLKTSGKGLLCLSGVSHDGSGATVRMRRSRDAGERWEESEQVISPGWEHAPVWSFAAACDERRDEVWLAYAVGEANHQLYVTQGRNGGRNWAQPVDVTKVGKMAGENVSFAGPGVVLRHNRAKQGRIVLPMLAGGEEQKVVLLVSESGQEWKKIGPVSGAGSGGVELAEGLDGKLYLSTGAPRDEDGNGSSHRLMMTSLDGGETWSVPAPSSLPDRGPAGSLSIFDAGKGEPVWYYVTVDGPVGPERASRNNLSLFGSRDGGKTWRVLKRFHHGVGKSPTVVPLGDGTVGIAYKRVLWTSHGDQVRFVRLAGGW